MSDDKKVTHVNFQYNRMMEQADTSAMQFEQELVGVIERAHENNVSPMIIVSLLQIYSHSETKYLIDDEE